MPVTDVNQLFKGGVGGARKQWQDEAWEKYRIVGELGYYVRWRANSCSRIRLVASEIDPDTGQPTGAISGENKEGQRVAEIVKSIAGGALGQSQLIKRVTECLSVPGELWIAVLIKPEAGWVDGSLLAERWFGLTHTQIEPGDKPNTAVFKLPDGSKHKFNREAGDGIFRVWNPDAEDPSLPDSPVRAVLDPLREIVRSTRKIANADDSRMINNGVLFIPSEASLPDTQAPVSADKPGDPPVAQPQRKVAGQLQQQIFDSATITAEEGPGSMASLVPIIVSAPAEHLGKINHLQFGKETTDNAIKTRTDAIARLAMGLDTSPERLLGFGDTNHWSSRSIADEDVQQHLAPVMETMCQAMYDSVLRNTVAAEGIDPTKYCLWYDATGLTADPDLTDEARDATEMGAFSLAAMVRQFKLPADGLYDLTTLEGCQVWARDVVQRDPTQLPMMAASGLLTAVEGFDFPQPAPQPAIEQAPPAESDPMEEPDTEDTSQEAAVREGTDFAVDLLVDRALDLAGKRRRTRADYDRLRAIPMSATHRVMGPVRRDQVPELIKGWDQSLDELARRYGIDASRIRASVRRRVERELTAQVIDAEVVG